MKVSTRNDLVAFGGALAMCAASGWLALHPAIGAVALGVIVGVPIAFYTIVAMIGITVGLVRNRKELPGLVIGLLMAYICGGWLVGELLGKLLFH